MVDIQPKAVSNLAVHTGSRANLDVTQKGPWFKLLMNMHGHGAFLLWKGAKMVNESPLLPVRGDFQLSVMFVSSAYHTSGVLLVRKILVGYSRPPGSAAPNMVHIYKWNLASCFCLLAYLDDPHSGEDLSHRRPFDWRNQCLR